MNLLKLNTLYLYKLKFIIIKLKIITKKFYNDLFIKIYKILINNR